MLTVVFESGSFRYFYFIYLIILFFFVFFLQRNGQANPFDKIKTKQLYFLPSDDTVTRILKRFASVRVRNLKKIIQR